MMENLFRILQVFKLLIEYLYWQETTVELFNFLYVFAQM